MIAFTTEREGSRTGGRDDADLVAACLAGDRRAWEGLVARYGRLVYAVARRTLRCEADAEDAFQEVFSIVHRKLDTLRDRSRLAPWLIRTTMRECYRLGRPNGRERPGDPGPDRPVASTDEQVAAWEQQEMVREALRRLGGRGERLLRALFAGPGRPDYEGIARSLNMRPGSIGPTRARCFAKLERILAEMGLDASTIDTL